jgi:phytoene synthase
MNAEEALAYCEGVTRAQLSTFYLGSSLFPPRQRQAVRVIYAVCRVGDDAVDECATRAEGWSRLEAWWRHIDRAYAGKPNECEPLELGLAWVLENYDVPLAAFQELYLGLEADLKAQGITTLDELMVYCRRVAGMVGWMIAPIAGYAGSEETLLDAVALGQAMQLTNILRDVGEDLALGRCYLPRELLEQHRVQLTDLRAGRVTEAYVALLEELIRLSRRLYALGWQSIPKLSGVAAVAVGLAALNYEAILDKLEQNSYDNLTRRAHLKQAERFAHSPGALFRVYGGRLAGANLKPYGGRLMRRPEGNAYAVLAETWASGLWPVAKPSGKTMTGSSSRTSRQTAKGQRRYA